MLRIATLATIALFFSPKAYAQGLENDQSVIYSYPSANSCADWTLERGSRRGQRLEGWVLGFISAFNAYGPGGGDVANGGNGNALLAWVDNYCRQNPLDDVTEAAFTLVQELRSRRSI